jgi:chemotaxis protein MotB
MNAVQDPPLDATLADTATAAEETPSPEHDSASGNHHGSRKGHGGHGDHAGGHGGSWIVTYCDMITLLIAFFICIMTFASSESGKFDHRKLRESVLYGEGGAGIAGADAKMGNHDSIVFRQLLTSANPARAGSSIPPLYSDPSMDVTNKALTMLDEPAKGTLADNYSIVIPLAVLVSADNSLTAAGKQLLRSIAVKLKTLPYDVLIHVDDQARLRRLVTIEQFLCQQEAVSPSRVGIGIGGPGTMAAESVRLLFVKRPKEVAR